MKNYIKQKVENKKERLKNIDSRSHELIEHFVRKQIGNQETSFKKLL